MVPIASKIGVYARVSSKDQDHRSQEAELRKWLEGEGVDPDQCRWYRDKESGKPGTAETRPALQQLRGDIFNGDVRTVVIWKADRLARSQRDGVALMYEWLDKGIRLVITTVQVDVRGSAGRLVAGVLFSIAEMGREDIRARQAAGIAVAKKNGVYKGRRPGTTTSTPKRAATLRAQGLVDSEIATALGVSRRTVQRYLRRGRAGSGAQG